MGSREVGSRELGSREVGSREVRSREVGTREVGREEVVRAVTSGVPAERLHKSGYSREVTLERLPQSGKRAVVERLQ